ncbi:sensor histidine kinase [Actinoplanes sp. NPDC089786]|uniref:sensor histidine kinase n=1 Tax=Actinoplanes sp. NPDC089786 TaxID=3155185 RepID=UPI00344850CA
MRNRPFRFQVNGAAVDTVAAAALAFLAVNATLDPPGPEFTGPAWLVWLAGVAVGLPIALRRRWPLPVLSWVVSAAAVATAAGVVGVGVIWTTWLPVVLALYTAVIVAPRVAVALALVGSLVAPSLTIPWLYLSAGIDPADAPGSEAPLWWQVEVGMVVVLVTAAWVVGWTVRWRRSVHAELARRLAQEAVTTERLRIARELHDIVGHSLSLIAVRATIANEIADARPGESRAALLTIEETSQTALAEIRRLLDVLRADDDPAPDLTPSPGVDDLPSVVEHLRSVGARADLMLEGVENLPQAVDLTVYRIVQEALTNVVRHANAGHCQVTVKAGHGSVHVEVLDDGRPQRSTGKRPTGQGLIGMRERVAMYGGTLTTGPRPEGGFRVAADIPYARARDAS